MEKNTLNKEITNWKELTNKITEKWIEHYFQLSKEEVMSGIDYYWVANDVGGVFEFADYYFDFSTVLKCFELNITKEQLFDWYNFCLESSSSISLAKYVKSPEERKEEEKKYLEELRERVKLAEKELEKALEQYESNKN